jgi:hypothetical protein
MPAVPVISRVPCVGGECCPSIECRREVGGWQIPGCRQANEHPRVRITHAPPGTSVPSGHEITRKTSLPHPQWVGPCQTSMTKGCPCGRGSSSGSSQAPTVCPIAPGSGGGGRSLETHEARRADLRSWPSSFARVPGEWVRSSSSPYGRTLARALEVEPAQLWVHAPGRVTN